MVNSEGTQVFLDFGRRMGFAQEFFSEFLQIRSKNALRDLLRLKILPKIDGVYAPHFIDTRVLMEDSSLVEKLPFTEAPDYWFAEDIQPYDVENPRIQAVFISHAHFDHIQDVSFLDPSIPIHSTSETKVLAKAICDVSRQGVDDQFFVCKRKQNIKAKNEHYKTLFPGELDYEPESDKTTINDEKTGYKFTREYTPKTRNFITDQTGNVGSITFRLIPVDHSVPGSCSILLTCEDGKRVLYTGDLRFHGSSGPSIDEYVTEIDDSVDALIIEGTRIEQENVLKEDKIKDQIKEDIEKAAKLVLINFNWKDLSRFKLIQEITEGLDKTFVISPKLAYLLYEMHFYHPGKYPDPRILNNVKVYLKREGSLLYSRVDYEKYKMGYLHHHGRNRAKSDWNMCRIAEILEVGGDIENDKSPLLNLDEPLCDYKEVYDLATHHLEHGVKAFEIRRSPQNYVMMFDYWDANDLFDLIPEQNSEPSANYICASTEPFNDEMQIDEEKFMIWLDHFNIKYEWEEVDEKLRFVRNHISGHVSQIEIREMIEKLNPERIIPIHTNKPELFEELFSEYEVILPEYGQTIEI